MARNKSELRLHPCPDIKIELEILKNINDNTKFENKRQIGDDEYQIYLYTMLKKEFIYSDNFGADGLEKVCYPKITLEGQEYLSYYSKSWLIRQFLETDWKYAITLIISITALILSLY